MSVWEWQGLHRSGWSWCTNCNTQKQWDSSYFKRQPQRSQSNRDRPAQIERKNYGANRIITLIVKSRRRWCFIICIDLISTQSNKTIIKTHRGIYRIFICLLSSLCWSNLQQSASCCFTSWCFLGRVWPFRSLCAKCFRQICTKKGCAKKQLRR